MDVAEIRKLDTYLKRVFSNPRLRVVPRPQKDDYAEVFLGEQPFGHLVVDDEDDDRCYNFEKAIVVDGLQSKNRKLDAEEVKKVDAFLKKTLGPRVSVHKRPTKTDSADVHIGDEFIGVLFVDEGSYNFQMAILEADLD